VNCLTGRRLRRASCVLLASVGPSAVLLTGDLPAQE
jgi:beta-lactamase superfamily II metal-dependent hydrolase